MPKKHISPHDRFIRSLMTNPKVVQEFFEKNLPDPIKEAIDFSSIQLEKDSFIDDKLRLQIADLLYSVNFQGEPGYLYLLMEHASSPDPLLPFRLLKYMTAIIDQHLKKTGTSKLPLIYPMVLYTGQRPFNHSMDLFDLFDNAKALAKDIFLGPYQLIDLTKLSDKELERYHWFRVAALLAKHIHDKDILPFLKSIMEQLRFLEKQGEIEYIYLTLTYLIEVGEVSDKEQFFQIITQGLESIDEDKVMTIAEQLKQEGYKKGLEKGKIEGKEEGEQIGAQKERLEIAHKMLDQGLAIEVISSLTGLKIEVIRKLLQ